MAGAMRLLHPVPSPDMRVGHGHAVPDPLNGWVEGSVRTAPIGPVVEQRRRGDAVAVGGVVAHRPDVGVDRLDAGAVGEGDPLAVGGPGRVAVAPGAAGVVCQEADPAGRFGGRSRILYGHGGPNASGHRSADRDGGRSTKDDRICLRSGCLPVGPACCCAAGPSAKQGKVRSTKDLSAAGGFLDVSTVRLVNTHEHAQKLEPRASL